MKKENIVVIFILSFSLSFSQKQTPSYNKNIDSLISDAIKFYRVNHDSLSHHFENIIPLAYANADILNLYELYNAQAWSADYFDRIEIMRESLVKLDALTLEFQSEFNNLEKGDQIYYTTQLNFTKGQYYYNISDYKKAKKYFKTILEDFDKVSDKQLAHDLISFTSECNIYLAIMSKSENKLALAQEYLNKNIRLLENRKGHLVRMNNTKLQLANSYSNDGYYQRAIDTILKCIPYYKEKNANSIRVIVNYHRIVENHVKLEQLDSARFYLGYLKTALDNRSVKGHLYFKSKSAILKAEQDYTKSVSVLMDYHQHLKTNFSEDKGDDMILNLLDIGQTYYEFENYNDALKNYDLALDQFSEDSINSTVNQTLKLKILRNKVRALNSLTDYTATLKTANQAITILDSLKPSFKTNSDKLFLIENAFPLFESGLEAAYHLFQDTSNSKYIDQAFFYSEKSKSSLLLESLLSSQATEFANVPSEIIENEKQLKAKITYLEKRINKNPTPELKDELFDLKQDHRNLITTIETDYKDFYDLKYNTQVTSLNQFKDQMTNNETMISYFYGNDHIYVISATKNRDVFSRISITEELENDVLTYHKLLQNPKSDINQLSALSHQLYKVFLKSSLETSTDQLVIIPDGLLHYIPFETLITSKDTNNYLIEDSFISYGLSVTLLEQLQHSAINGNANVLAFAPDFKGSVTVGEIRSELLPLAHTSKEVKQILNHFDGEAYIDENATLNNFTNNLSNHGIIHLATHASLNDEHPDYSYLAFSNTNSNTEHLLYASDIYNTTTNANMVTLSACETGIGQLKRGEGAISLARSFFYSGASSITSTLWKINDASAAKIMDLYYAQLAKGDSKDVALQQSKLNYIKANKDTNLSHPYYWSGFVVSGNIEPLTTSTNWWWMFGIIGLVAMILFINSRRKSA